MIHGMLGSLDGCKKGWILAYGEEWPCKETPQLRLLNNFDEVLEFTNGFRVVVVDMPIGLPSGPEPRLCDLLARTMVGVNGQNSVFLTPPRRATVATNPNEFQNIHREERDIGAGVPVYGILPKLREVDDIITPALQTCVFEFHPELTWIGLAGEVFPSKHTASGVLRRIEILRKNNIEAESFGSGPISREIKIDDLLDAVVGLSVASYIESYTRDKKPVDFSGHFERRLPCENPPRDNRGLRMEIWY